MPMISDFNENVYVPTLIDARNIGPIALLILLLDRCFERIRGSDNGVAS